MMYCELTDAVC